MASSSTAVRSRRWRIELEELERRELFIVPLDPQHLTYRYHQPFADILSSASAAPRACQVPPTPRAGLSMVEHSQVHEAVHHALLAENTESLAQVLDPAGGWRIIPEGRMEALVSGLAHGPEAVIARSRAWCSARVSDPSNRARWIRRLPNDDAFRDMAVRTKLAPDLWTEVNPAGDVLADYETAPTQLDYLLAQEALIRSLASHASDAVERLRLSRPQSTANARLERGIEPIRRARSQHLALHSMYGESFPLPRSPGGARAGAVRGGARDPRPSRWQHSQCYGPSSIWRRTARLTWPRCDSNKAKWPKPSNYWSGRYRTWSTPTAGSGLRLRLCCGRWPPWPLILTKRMR